MKRVSTFTFSSPFIPSGAASGQGVEAQMASPGFNTARGVRRDTMPDISETARPGEPWGIKLPKVGATPDRMENTLPKPRALQLATTTSTFSPAHSAFPSSYESGLEPTPGAAPRNAGNALAPPKSAFLVIAAEKNQFSSVEKLIANGAGFDAVNGRGRTALMIAASKSNFEIVECLLKASADPNVVSSEGDTALKIVVRRGSEQMLKCLLDGGAEINMRDDDGLTVLMYAILNGYIKMACCLMEKGSDASLRNREGKTALMMLISTDERNIDRHQRRQLMDLLIKSRASLEIADNRGCTALMKAVLWQEVDVCKQLLDHGAIVDQVDSEGGTALLYAVRHKKAEIAELLLKRGADPHKKTDDGTSPWLLRQKIWDAGLYRVMGRLRGPKGEKPRNLTPKFLARFGGSHRQERRDDREYAADKRRRESPRRSSQVDDGSGRYHARSGHSPGDSNDRYRGRRRDRSASSSRSRDASPGPGSSSAQAAVVASPVEPRNVFDAPFVEAAGPATVACLPPVPVEPFVAASVAASQAAPSWALQSRPVAPVVESSAPAAVVPQVLQTGLQAVAQTASQAPSLVARARNAVDAAAAIGAHVAAAMEPAIAPAPSEGRQWIDAAPVCGSPASSPEAFDLFLQQADSSLAIDLYLESLESLADKTVESLMAPLSGLPAALANYISVHVNIEGVRLPLSTGAGRHQPLSNTPLTAPMMANFLARRWNLRHFSGSFLAHRLLDLLSSWAQAEIWQNRGKLEVTPAQLRLACNVVICSRAFVEAVIEDSPGMKRAYLQPGTGIEVGLSKAWQKKMLLAARTQAMALRRVADDEFKSAIGGIAQVLASNPGNSASDRIAMLTQEVGLDPDVSAKVARAWAATRGQDNARLAFTALLRKNLDDPRENRRAEEKKWFHIDESGFEELRDLRKFITAQLTRIFEDADRIDLEEMSKRGTACQEMT